MALNGVIQPSHQLSPDSNDFIYTTVAFGGGSRMKTNIVWFVKFQFYQRKFIPESDQLICIGNLNRNEFILLVKTSYFHSAHSIWAIFLKIHHFSFFIDSIVKPLLGCHSEERQFHNEIDRKLPSFSFPILLYSILEKPFTRLSNHVTHMDMINIILLAQYDKRPGYWILVFQNLQNN